MLGVLNLEFIFLSMIAIFIATALLSLLLHKSDSFSNQLSGYLSIAGSTLGLLFSGLILVKDLSFAPMAWSSTLPVLSFSVAVDTLSAFFIFTISLISLLCSIYGLGYIKHYYGKYNIGLLGFLYNLLVVSLILIACASNALFFLIVWELMALSSYLLVVYEHREKENIKAGLQYFAMTYVGTAFILLGFLLIYKYVGSFDFATIRDQVELIPFYIKNIIFVLMLVGFGIKSGIIPFHVWLPSAHTATPSYISALMSGVIIKMGIYMMVRVFLDLLQPVPEWWGVAILILGAISALLGVLYAITEHDIKKLLAYHSIENIGIILLGLGSSLIFLSIGMNDLALLSLIASLFHTLNHAIFKSLLFFSAGAVVSQTHTRNMEEYGGLIKYMPLTTLFFLVGSMAISALPPFNGFFSEWLTFQALFQGIIVTDASMQWVFISATGALVFTGGLALFCFVKVFGIVFLARPRSQEVEHVKESAKTMLFGMGALAVIALVIGVFSGYVVSLLDQLGRKLFNFDFTSNIIATNNAVAVEDFSVVSSTGTILFFIVAFLLIYIIQKTLVNKNQVEKVVDTWNCGTELTPRMEITATGFARSIVLIFKGLLKPSIQNEVQYNDASSRYIPKSRIITLGIIDVYQVYFYQPIEAVVGYLSLYTKKIQSGNINIYVLYIFLALMISLYWYL